MRTEEMPRVPGLRHILSLSIFFIMLLCYRFHSIKGPIDKDKQKSI
jgi:hypothetical protein